jgi:hypothetical protein
MAKNTYAVLIADVVESGARPDLRALLGRSLAAASREHLAQRAIRLPYAVTAGDEFQTIAWEAAKVPALILDLRCRLYPLRLRIGIGIGSIAGRIRPPVNRLGGEAFRRARQAIEGLQDNPEFKFEGLTAFRSPDRALDATVNLIYALHDTLVLRIKNKQWETIRAFRATRRMDRTARKLRVDTSTVSRNLKRGYFWQMEQTAAGVEMLIRQAKM